MKKIYLFITVFFVVATLSSQVINTCLFDFSYNAGQLQSGTGWNNVMPTADQDFIDNNSVKVGHLVSSGWTSANTSGTTAPTSPASDDFPTATQTQDNIYGQSGAVGTITLSGLDVTKFYSFTVFGSRAGVTDNRETVYTFTGLNSRNASLDASSNTGNVAIVNNIQPTSEGVIVFTTTAGPNNNNSSKYFYLAAMKMLVSTTASGIKYNLYDGKVYYSNNAIYSDNLMGIAKIFSLSGTRIAEGTFVDGKLNVVLQPGIYILSVGNVHRKFSVN